MHVSRVIVNCVQVEGSFAASREFFALSEESKAVFATNAGCGPNGYSSINAKRYIVYSIIISSVQWKC